MENPPPVPPAPPSLPPNPPVPPRAPAPAPAPAPMPGAQPGGKKMGALPIVIIVVAVGFVGLCGVAVLAGMLLPALAKAKSKAQTIQCVNNLKQLGLAARIYAVDHDGRPPGTWLQASNELGSPMILACPADGKHPKAVDWASFSGDANISYPWYGRGATESQTNRVLSVCPVHGNVLLVDGAVFQTRPGNPPAVEQRGTALWFKGR